MNTFEKKIAVLSGKGGTGKTAFSVNLSLILAKQGYSPLLADLDVEEPNVHLFFKESFESEEPISLLFPSWNKDACNFCGLCASNCRFHSLAVFKDDFLFFQELCHSCGRCAAKCPRQALIEKPLQIGVLRKGNYGTLRLYEGRLDEGKTQTSSMIREIKKQLPQTGLQIWDGPPGTSCPSLESVKGADLIVLITEPTPFGFHDFKLTVEALKPFGIKTKVVVNKWVENNLEIELFCEKNNLTVLGKIPFSKQAAEAYSSGKSFWEFSDMRDFFLDMSEQIMEERE